MLNHSISELSNQSQLKLSHDLDNNPHLISFRPIISNSSMNRMQNYIRWIDCMVKADREGIACKFV